MTNQVNQEFEKWFVKENYFLQSNLDDDTCKSWKDFAYQGWQAATQASESEINSLKQRVEELEAEVDSQNRIYIEHCNSRMVLINSFREARNQIKKLTASNNQLREALEVCKYDCHTGEVIGIAEKALKATP